tara:strand:- start:139 stop:243 length:105 start_codon:yes stop_codon:yes gene_type:complete
VPGVKFVPGQKRQLDGFFYGFLPFPKETVAGVGR